MNQSCTRLQWSAHLARLTTPLVGRLTDFTGCRENVRGTHTGRQHSLG